MPSIRLVEVHPILVHFPIALLIISVLTLFVLRLIWLSPRILSALRPSLLAAARLERSSLTIVPILGKRSRTLITLYLVASLAGLAY